MSVAPSPLGLGTGEVHLWHHLADAPAGPVEIELLDDHERRRASRFRFEELRQHYMGAHVALRRVLAAYLGCEPAEVAFASDCEHCGHPGHGRPRLGGELASSGLHFSLSHSGALALIGVARCRAVGVDVEVSTRKVLGQAMVAHVCSAAEASFVGEGEGAELRFLQIWCYKEALGKAAGLGIAYAMRSVNAAPGPGAEGAWAETHMPDARAYSVTSLDMVVMAPHEAIGAVALRGEPAELWTFSVADIESPSAPASRYAARL